MVRSARFFMVLTAFTGFLVASVPAYADIKAVASIKPVHSLVSMVLGAKGRVSVLIDGAASPHTYALTPRQASDIQSADVIFWVGEPLEAFLAKPLQTIGANVRQIDLLSTPGVQTLALREGGAFEAHAHDDHEGHDDHNHKDHDNHGHKGHDDHHDHAKHDDHDDHAKHDDHENHDGHAHSADEFDPHIWLDPHNAKAMLYHIAHVLGDLDPAHRAAFEQNAEQAAARIDQMMASIKADIDPVKEGEFIVFHDAYHYFEDAFGLQAAGAISINPERLPGAQRVGEIRTLIQDEHIRCVFTEPQFEPKIIRVILEGTGKKSVQIDPLGATLTAGSEMYFTLLEDMRDAFLTCLG